MKKRKERKKPEWRGVYIWKKNVLFTPTNHLLYTSGD